MESLLEGYGEHVFKGDVADRYQAPWAQLGLGPYWDGGSGEVQGPIGPKACLDFNQEGWPNRAQGPTGPRAQKGPGHNRAQ